MDAERQLFERTHRPRSGTAPYKPVSQSPKVILVQGEVAKYKRCDFCNTTSDTTKETPVGRECATCRQGPRCDDSLHPVPYLGAPCNACANGAGA